MSDRGGRAPDGSPRLSVLDEGGASGPISGEEARPDMLTDVRDGLTRPQKSLSSKYFYDTRGSELFERITTLPEYYPTRTERALLERWAPVWVEREQPEALVELGAGSASKTRILLDAMERADAGSLFIPLDVGEDFLHETAEQVRREYPGFTVRPEVADLTHSFRLSEEPPVPSLYALLGSTIGNFDREGAVEMLSHVRGVMHRGDAFLMGADLRPGREKTVDVLERAYNDAAGVTAEFNLNMLRVLNRELGTDFDLDAFRHRAFYDDEKGRIEMHLVARSPQIVTLPGGEEVRFEEGETVRTEISCKYDRPTVDELFAPAGLEVEEWREDPEGLYALVLARPA